MSQEKFNAMMAISIHAPTRGATQQSFIQQTAKRFQSTLPREERHARSRFDYLVFQFQSTLPREERPNLCTCCVGNAYFNPRSHERSDRKRTIHDDSYSYFNPRSHERSDPLVYDDSLSYYISIHAPTRGATTTLIMFTYIVLDFNPRSHERSDITSPTYTLIAINFNPRSHERSD